jgi:dTDP-4-dehydrorhamnose 3,5-epimerase
MAATSVSQPTRRISADGDPYNLVYPRCEFGIGDLILSPDSPKLIADVQAEPYSLWPDDRGYFMEIARMGEGLADAMPLAHTQISAALSYPTTIKAFHYHQHQTDYWSIATGMFQVALVDLRVDSATFGARNTLYLGTLRPWRLLIPPGVAHGYKVLGSEPGLLVYLTSRKYDGSDEGRIAHDDSDLAYDWELQYK